MDNERRHRCAKPFCRNSPQVFGSKWCSEGWYPGIDREEETYKAYCEDGYSVHLSMLMAGWRTRVTRMRMAMACTIPPTSCMISTP